MRILDGSITSKLPDSLSMWALTISATRSASARFESLSSSSKITPPTLSRWRITSSPKSRSSVYQDAAFAFCYFENIPIWGAGSRFRHGFHVVTGGDKALGYRARNIFVRQKTHYSVATTVSCCK
jgi:hypothetical protein